MQITSLLVTTFFALFVTGQKKKKKNVDFLLVKLQELQHENFML